jgi:DNA repair exonuclease SbcCD nuclease subunit
MDTLTFLHTADEHIDTETHGSMNPKTGLNTAMESNVRALRHLAEAAVKRGASAFISAGDEFRTGRPSQEAMLSYVDGLAPLEGTKIPVVLLDGNHHKTGIPSDHRTVIFGLQSMLTGRGIECHIAAEPRLIRLDSGLQIAALPWMSKNRVLNSLGRSDASAAEGDRLVSEYGMATLERLAAEADANAHLIMASHVTVDDLRIDGVLDGFRRGSEMEIAHLFSEPVLPRAALEKLPFEYGALGHIHAPQAVGHIYHYAGSPNRMTFTDMPDTKGGNFVTLNADRTITVEQIVTPARVMQMLDLDEPDVEGALATITAGALVQVRLETGVPDVPQFVRKAITKAGATLADSRPRPAPRVAVPRVELPKSIDPITALRTWAHHHAPATIDIDQLIKAAQNLEE